MGQEFHDASIRSMVVPGAAVQVVLRHDTVTENTEPARRVHFPFAVEEVFPDLPSTASAPGRSTGNPDSVRLCDADAGFLDSVLAAARPCTSEWDLDHTTLRLQERELEPGLRTVLLVIEIQSIPVQDDVATFPSLPELTSFPETPT